jgi:hypothetical protein
LAVWPERLVEPARQKDGLAVEARARHALAVWAFSVSMGNQIKKKSCGMQNIGQPQAAFNDERGGA